MTTVQTAQTVRVIRRPGAAITSAIAIGLAIALGAFLALTGSPIPLVAIVVATAVLVALVLRPDRASLLFFGIFYVNVPVVAVRLHGVPESVAILTPVLLTLPVIAYVLVRRQPVITPPVLGLLVAYLFALMISAIFSSDPAATVPWIANFAAEGLLLYFLVANAVRTMAMLRAVIWTLLIAGALMGSLSVFQEVTQTYENSYLGFAQTKFTPGFEEDEEAVLEADDRPRLGGPIGSKNRYAQVMLVLLPLAVFAFANERSHWLRLLAVVAGVLILAGMSLTFSRGAGVAVAGMLGLLVILRYVRIWQALVLTILTIGAIWFVAPDYVVRLASITQVGSLVTGEGEEPDGAILGRATSNLAALNTFSDYPLVGVGPGQYVDAFSQEYANELGLRHLKTNRRAHNLYLEIAADTGIVGITVFLAIVAVTLRGLWRTRRYWLTRSPEYANWATAFLVSVSGYLISAVFLHLSYVRYFWALIALANVTVWMLERERERRSAHDEAVGASPGRLQTGAP